MDLSGRAQAIKSLEIIMRSENGLKMGSDPTCVCPKQEECSTTSAAEAWNYVRGMLGQFTKTHMAQFNNTHWMIELDITNAGNPFPYSKGNRSQGWDLQLMLDHLKNEFLATLKQDASGVVWLGKANAADDPAHCNAVTLKVRYAAGFPMSHGNAAADVSEIVLRAFARDTQLICELVEVKYAHVGSASENFARAVSLAS